MAPRPRRWWLVEGGGKAEDWRPGCTVRAPEAEPSTGGWMMGRRWLPEIPTGQPANISGDGGHDQPASPATEEVKHSPPTSCYIIGKTYRHWLRIVGTQAHRVKLIYICNTQENIFSTVDIMLAYSVWGYRTHPLLQKRRRKLFELQSEVSC